MTQIMVVEDDRAINEVVAEYLKDAGYGVAAVYDGAEALALLEDSAAVADFFVLDIMLPGVSGTALLKAIRAHTLHSRKPVMMLSAISDEYTQLQSFSDLADDYVTKPFSPRILVRRVQALLRRAASETRTARYAPQEDGTGGVRRGVLVNAEGYVAYEDGEPLPLTLREFELLKTLTEHSKRVLTRQQLLDAVWGYDYYGDERVVDVHIKNLRKKMRSGAIVTVKGVGYKYDETAGSSL